MPGFKRQPATGFVPRPRYLRARFASLCPCGARIAIGDLMCYDGVSKRSLCVRCGKAQEKAVTKQITPVLPMTEAQRLMDRISMLQALPAPISDSVKEELSQLVSRLQTQAGSDEMVKKNLIKSKVSRRLISITARYPGRCEKCNSRQEAGNSVAYDPIRRKIICVDCLDSSERSA